MAYAELHCRSYFSFLAGASEPEALVARAHALGYRALALTDVDGVYGAPRAHHAARAVGLSLIIGCELTIGDDEDAARAYRPAGRLVLLALDGRGWARLCRIISAARLAHPKGRACLAWADLAHDTTGLVALSGGAAGPAERGLARGDLGAAQRWLARLREAFGERAYVELSHHLRPGDDERLAALVRLGRELRLPRVVTQDARYATADERPLHDVLACVRLGRSLGQAGRALASNGEWHLHPPAEIERRFAGVPDALERTVALAAQATFSLEALRYRFPDFPLPPGETPFSYLYELTMQGARTRYRPITAKVLAQLSHELGVIERMRLAGYFLIVWDIVRFCREKQILCQGRGSAANSAVCYALGITAVDPVGMELLFERFLSEERSEMPDIDLDITHQRREEVIQYVYERYGRERAAMANEIISYRARSAIRDVGKALGLSLAQIDTAAKAVDRFESDGVSPEPAWSEAARARSLAQSKALGLDTNDPTVAMAIGFARALEGFPRHLGIHSGGMVLAQGALCEVVPIENATMPGRTVVQWDKDDLNGLGIIKIDLLGLGMLTVIDGAIQLARAHQGVEIDLAHLPPDDARVYDLICRADTVGVFQIESRAQMSMLPRLRPRTFYDLVIEVAIIRPGPIQGDMVHPYLRRRNGEETIEYAHPSLEPVLRRTLGVPLFQEQGMKLAVVAAGFTAGEADELRRAMGHKRSRERMEALRARLRAGMMKNGISADAADRIWRELAAFADYGFPESHAASFALLVYASAWLKCYYPAAFLAALLNAQPMGFYAPHTLVSDARRHGVTVLPPCARRSTWLARLEPDPRRPGRPAVRLGITSVRGAGDGARARFEAAQAWAPFASVADFTRRSGLGRAAVEHLAAAGGFDGFGLSRREALWQLAALAERPERLPLLTEVIDGDGEPVDKHGATPAGADARVGATLPPMTPSEALRADFIGLGLSIDKNPVALVRADLDARGVRRAVELPSRARAGERIAIAGMVICRQRPATAKGMVFMTLEDETGLANLVLTPDVYERLRPTARDEPLVVAHGKVERQGQVVNVRVENMSTLDAAVHAVVPARNFR
jgi:error-prone DNA polymerase